MEDDRAPLPGSSDGGDGVVDVVGEARWPMVGAVVAAIVLTLLLPDDLRLGPNWALPVLEAALLVTLIASDPGSITRRSRELRAVGIALVAVLGLSALVATGSLIDSLLTGGPETDSASELLRAGANVWTSNNIAFALLFWELDGGGAAARARGLPTYPDIAFPQQLNPHIAEPGWRPRFIDYLDLGFTYATASGWIVGRLHAANRAAALVGFLVSVWIVTALELPLLSWLAPTVFSVTVVPLLPMMLMMTGIAAPVAILLGGFWGLRGRHRGGAAAG